MKTQLKSLLRALALLALLSTANLASAYYDPGLQRWLNRDPVGENGFRILRSTRFHIDAFGSQTPVFVFLHNNPENAIDPLGLSLLAECGGKCGVAALGASVTGLGLAFGLKDKYIISFYGELLEPGECIYVRSPLARLIGLATCVDLSGFGQVWMQICKDKNGKISVHYIVLQDSPSA